MELVRDSNTYSSIMVMAVSSRQVTGKTHFLSQACFFVLLGL